MRTRSNLRRLHTLFWKWSGSSSLTCRLRVAQSVISTPNEPRQGQWIKKKSIDATAVVKRPMIHVHRCQGGVAQTVSSRSANHRPCAAVPGNPANHRHKRRISVTFCGVKFITDQTTGVQRSTQKDAVSRFILTLCSASSVSSSALHRGEQKQFDVQYSVSGRKNKTKKLAVAHL